MFPLAHAEEATSAQGGVEACFCVSLGPDLKGEASQSAMWLHQELPASMDLLDSRLMACLFQLGKLAMGTRGLVPTPGVVDC